MTARERKQPQLPGLPKAQGTEDGAALMKGGRARAPGNRVREELAERMQPPDKNTARSAQSREKDDQEMQSLRQKAARQHGFNSLLQQSRYDAESCSSAVTPEEEEKFSKLGILFFKTGHVVISSIVTDEKALGWHSEKFREKKFRQSVGGGQRLPSSKQLKFYPCYSKALRGVMHTAVGGLKSANFMSEVADALEKIEGELKSKKEFGKAREQKMRRLYDDVLQKTGSKAHFYTKLGVEKLESKGLPLLEERNYPALSWVMAAAGKRFWARQESIGRVVAKAEKRRELFKEHIRRQFREERREEKKLELLSDACAIKMWERWVRLNTLSLGIAEYYAAEFIKNEVYRLNYELAYTENTNSIRALYKWRAFFSRAEIGEIMDESKKEKPNFKRILDITEGAYKRYSEWRDAKGAELAKEARSVAGSFRRSELVFEEAAEARDGLAALASFIAPLAIPVPRPPSSKVPARPKLAELRERIAPLLDKLENFKAEFALDKAEKKIAEKSIER